ncbi:MAG: hypothetical protein ABIH66_10820 [bacterium]
MNSTSKYIAPLIVVFLGLTISCFAIDNAPQIKIEYTVTLPGKMQKALDEFDPEFRVFAQSEFSYNIINKAYVFSAIQAPSAVIGDFNGDGVKDVALFGRNKTNSRILCILSNGENFRVYDIESFNLEIGMIIEGPENKDSGLNIFLYYQPPDTVESLFEETGLDLTSDSIVVVYFEKASKIVYFKENAFHSYLIAD